MYILKDCSYAEKKLDERWRTLLEEEIDNCAPMTFIACTAVAGMVSEFRAEESVKLVLSHGGRELDFIANTALLFASRGGYIPCENAKFKINSKEASDGGTYLMDRIPVMQEILTKNDYYTHHKTIIVVDEEWLEDPFETYLQTRGLPLTVWLEVKPWRSWFKYKESALRAVTAYRDVSGYKSEQAYRQLIKWGDEGMIDILDSAVEDFKRRAEEKGLYEDAPEAFYKQIGLILVALKLMQKVYGIHTKKKELEKFIFEHVTVAWHTKVVDQCDEYPYEDSEEGDLF